MINRGRTYTEEDFRREPPLTKSDDEFKMVIAAILARKGKWASLGGFCECGYGDYQLPNGLCYYVEDVDGDIYGISRYSYCNHIWEAMHPKGPDNRLITFEL